MYMRRLFILTLCLLTIIMAEAGPVSEQEAYQIAQQFMQGKLNTSPTNAPQRKALKSARVASAQKNLYIFNAENDGGFVIVSGDDRTPSVLGYSDCGNLRTDSLPENVKWLLDYYDRSIASLGNSTAKRAAATTTRADIEPMLETEWNPGSPFNNLLPEKNGQKCVAFEQAMAQIIYYNRWPQGETASIEKYNLPAVTFDWNNMSDNSLAQLMLYCTRAADLNYTSATSCRLYYGSTDSPEYKAFVNVFGYSDAKYALRENFTDGEWDELLYGELAASRPVFYYGKGGTYVATFVVDGYSDGMYHVNWGNYNGACNGYFALDLFINEYGGKEVYKGIYMIYNLCPPADAGEIAKPQATVVNMAYDFADALSFDDFFTIVPTLSLERSSATDAFPSFNVSTTIESKGNATLQVGLALYNDDGLVKVLKEETHDFTSERSYTLNADLTIDASVPQGDYRLVAVSRSGSAAEWMPNSFSTDRFIKATVSGSKLELDLERYLSSGDATVDGIEYYTFTAAGNNYAVMLATENNRALSGDVVIPEYVKYLGKAYNVCEMLIADCPDLTSLDVSQCKWLHKLICDGKEKLTSIKIGDCDITYLSCYGDSLLSTLDVSKCKSLKRLDCQGCALTSLNLDQCTDLEYLNCGGNALTSLDLAKCTKLEFLSCYKSSLTSLDLSQCHSLKELYCRDNSLTSLDLSMCDSLKTLHCNSNNLSTLLVNSSVLEKLYCRDNKLESLDLRKCENLETFEHGGNEETLKELLLGKCKIDVLYLGSALTTLDVSQCDSLKTLYIPSGNLKTLTMGANKKLEDLSCPGSQLTTLDVSQCNSLKRLYCDSFEKKGILTSLNVSGCTALTRLDCYNNALTSLDVSSCKNLEDVDVRNNELTSLDFSSCKKLQIMSANGNPLTSLDISQCEELGGILIFDKNLVELRIGKNKVKSIFFNSVNDKFTSLDVSQCDSLETLRLEGSNLTTLVMGKNEKLNDLRLWYNKLTSLDLSLCSKLDYLNCEGNKITTFRINDDAPLSTFIVGSNSFGFSQVTPRMYELLSNNDEYGSGGKGYVHWRPAYDLYAGDILDLSQEMTAYDGSAVTISVEKSYEAVDINGDDGKYTLPEATYYDVKMTCESMPNIYFSGSFDVGNASNIEQLPMDGMEISINGGVVNVNGLADDVKAKLYDTAGRMVGSAQGGSALSINAPGSGIYILRLSDAQGRTSAVKLMVK